MNFQDLMKRMVELDQPAMSEDLDRRDIENSAETMTLDQFVSVYGEENEHIWHKVNDQQDESAELTDGCGDMSMSPMEPAKQMDNVSMNVSMNANGSGGLRDLLNVLKDIQDGPDSEPVSITSIDDMGSMIDDDFANEPDEAYGSMQTVMPTGDDLHSKGREAPKVNGGGNPLTHMPRLESLYKEIMSRK